MNLLITQNPSVLNSDYPFHTLYFSIPFSRSHCERNKAHSEVDSAKIVGSTLLIYESVVSSGGCMAI